MDPLDLGGKNQLMLQFFIFDRKVAIHSEEDSGTISAWVSEFTINIVIAIFHIMN